MSVEKEYPLLLLGKPLATPINGNFRLGEAQRQGNRGSLGKRTHLYVRVLMRLLKPLQRLFLFSSIKYHELAVNKK